MPGTRSTCSIILLAFGAFTALGCVGTDTGPQGETGSLSVDLVLADGIEIDEVTWQITGNGMDMSGDIDVSAPGSTASVEVFGLPPGDEDYTVMLTATSTDEEVTCKGSAPFNVEIGRATEVMVMLNCKKPRTLGGVRVNGKFNICTQLTKVVVSPLQTSVGNDITLMSQAFDEEADEIMYIWSGDGGSIADPSAANTTYTCEEIGEHMVTILVTDNDVYCKMATWTVPVTCVKGDVDLCDGVDCDDGNECTDNDCNPASGECINDPVDDGTDCGDGGMCSGGECVDIDQCEGVDCDDSNECTADLCNPLNGECSNLPVDNGTDCNGTDGMCVDGECIDIISKCDGVICDDTGNDCTVAMCNLETGECDTMDVPDGTECLDGTGLCAKGVCVVSKLCDGVDCPSTNQCVEDGVCDPTTGMCIKGDAKPADTTCDQDGGIVCDGGGNCVACNDASQCTDDGNACTTASCVDNVCGQANEPDGTMCDLLSVGDGVCMAGVCEAAPDCTVAGDCDDGNECTAGDCVEGMCEFTPTDGASCLVEPGVPGTCDNAGACIGLCDGVDCTSSNQCVQDGSCDVQSGECIPGANEPEGTACTDNSGTVCDGAGTCVECNVDQDCSGGDVCADNVCTPLLPAPPQTATTISSCGLPTAVSTNLVPFPTQLSVVPTTPAIAGQTFSASVDPAVILDPAFLQGAAATLFEGFAIYFTELNLTSAQVQIAATSGCGQECVGGSFNVGGACTADIDCDADGVQPYTGQCIAAPGGLTLDTGTLPRIITVPNAAWPCSTDADCQKTNQLDSGICCTGVGAPAQPGFCEGGTEAPNTFCDTSLAIPIPCPAGGTCVGTCFAAGECSIASVPPHITGGVTLDSFDPVSYSCTAGASGETISICTTGLRAASVTPTAPPTETFVKVDVGALTNIGFDCETGAPQNPNDCECPSAGVSFCLDAVNCPSDALCFPANPTTPKGVCSDPLPFTLKYEPTGTICAGSDANAGDPCTTNADCDLPCDDLTELCGDNTTACPPPNGNLKCAGTQGGTCVPACVQYAIP